MPHPPHPNIYMGQQYVGQLSQGYGIPQQSYRQQSQQLPTSTVAAAATPNLTAFPASSLSTAPIVGAVAPVVVSAAAGTVSTEPSSQLLPLQSVQLKRERRVLKIINPETQECLNENDVASSETTASDTNNESVLETLGKSFDIKCNYRSFFK